MISYVVGRNAAADSETFDILSSLLLALTVVVFVLNLFADDPPLYRELSSKQRRSF